MQLAEGTFASCISQWRERILGETGDDGETAKELDKERETVKAEVAAFVDDGDDSLIEERIVAAREEQRAKEGLGVAGRLAQSVNPVARALGPLQAKLAKAVVPLRAIRYILFWQDRFLTSWLCIGLALLALVLAIVPWATVLHYCCRLASLGLFGPHMHFVGRRVDAARLATKAELRRYRESNDAQREAILEEYRKVTMAEAQAKARAKQLELAKRSPRELERLRYLEGQRFNFVNGHTRANARIKYAAIADPRRSSAHATGGLGSGSPPAAEAQPVRAPAAVPADLFAKIDTNNDGVISREEFEAYQRAAADLGIIAGGGGADEEKI